MWASLTTGDTVQRGFTGAPTKAITMTSGTKGHSRDKREVKQQNNETELTVSND